MYSSVLQTLFNEWLFLGWNLESASECPQESRRQKRTTADRLSQLDAYASNMARMASYSPVAVATPQGIAFYI